jgi:choline kinase
VLAAGNGDRFHNGSHQSKLLQPLFGEPLIVRTLSTAASAGITHFHVVLGYEADAVRAAIERGLPPGASARYTHNPDWHLENGVSALAVRASFTDRHFALLMGDHLFEPRVLADLLRVKMAPRESVLAVDSRPAAPHIAAEATRVRLDGDRITAIGKELAPYDALDTGLFVCAPALFAALDVSRAAGDTTLSGGIRRLADQGLMRAREVGNAVWYDIDTVADLESAIALLAEPETA